MTLIKEKIEKWAKETLEVEDVALVHPKEIKNGDYAFFAGEQANDFGQSLQQSENKPAEISEVEVVGSFINFRLAKEFFADSIKEINDQGEKFGETKLLAGQKIMVEYTDPNPFKEFHIGHLMSNAIGESVSRIIEGNGAEVKRANWQGDVGMHVAKAIWGIKYPVEGELNTEEPFKDLLSAFGFGKAYARGAKAYEEDEEARKKIVEINKKIYNKSDKEINEIYEKGRNASLDYFEHIYARLGTKFDHYFFESKEGVKGQSIVESHVEDGIFEKSDGAVVFRGENHGLHTRVFINSEGLPTYEAKELGLNKEKFEVEPDLAKSIIVTGNEIKDYFKVLLKVISLIFPKIAEKTIHLPHGMLRLREGKMSSRTGNIITAETLIDQVKEKVLEKIQAPTSLKATTGQAREFSAEEKENIAEMVAIGAIKYSILRQAIGGDIVFDFEKSISFEGDSGPYLQYTAVRAKSVLEKANLTPPKASPRLGEGGGEVLQNWDLSREALAEWEPTEVERMLYRFPEIVERAGKEYAPHHLVTYLTELASAFNSFYGNNKIINEEDPTSSYKVALTESVYHVLKNGLHLLGIKVPERM